jgi:hypothetical protein
VVNFAHNVWNIVAVAIGRFVQSRTGIVFEFHDPRFRIGRPRQRTPGSSFIDIAILRVSLFAFTKTFQDCRAPRYQRGLIRKPLRKIGVILLHDVERRFLGELAMVLGKQPVHGCELFIGHGLAPSRRRRLGLS